MKTSYSRNRINPLEAIKFFWPNADISHIKHDAKLEDKQYSIVRGSTHDGTLTFSNELLCNVLAPIVNKQSYFKATEPKDWSEVIDVEYVIGDIKQAIVFGNVVTIGDTSGYPGQRERLRLPVVCRYIYKEERCPVQLRVT